ncbi:uncharacterized protein LOC111029549 [Myzus persicae]|uniref:uncharacterized protein LOC111029549 n=1 Tax=Myzus persicae TaxID=13164 RepID=UPI000B9358DF|nr:uncharacterized protein LOC111029549 [Myzus persicae]
MYLPIIDSMILIKMFVLVGVSSSTLKQNLFMPNLPLGEYRIFVEKFYRCESTRNHTLQFNCYLSKRTLNITELKGNFTLLVPFDDTVILDINFASWSLSGGWKPNAIVYKTRKACTHFKNVLGKTWNSVIKDFNIPTSSCPIPVGTYISSGLDLRKLEEHNFPKVYFYGKYKMTISFKNENNKLLGCAILELSLIRPWEKPI